jgi:hypothetical protein
MFNYRDFIPSSILMRFFLLLSVGCILVSVFTLASLPD